MHDPFHAAGWFRALTLRERLASSHPGGRRAPAMPAERELAARRLQRWQSQPPFLDRELFARRLAMDGASEPDLLALLGEPAEALRERCGTAPAWLSELASALSRPPSGEGPSPDAPGGEPASFLEIVRPLLDRALDRVRQEVAALARPREGSPLETATAVRVCSAQLPESLMAMLNRTLVLELNVARLEGELTGDSPQERFQSFAQRLRRPDVARALLEEYPVLARQLVHGLERWVTVTVEFLRRLRDDWDAIRAELHPGGDPGLLVELRGAGDTHRGGRRVLVAGFGSGFRVVYKPKSLAADRHLQELLVWLDRRGADPPFRSLRVLDRGDYGWVEHVATQGCTSSAEVERFYRRLGGYLALFYVLEATDFHAENLLAAGEHPMPIDLEALFHPRLKNPAHPEEDEAYLALAHSVTRVGLLPERIWATGDSPGVDMSGMGNPGSQLTPFHVPLWKEHGTDTMQLVRERVPMLATENQPTLGGAPVDLLQYGGAIEAGFRRTYEMLLRHRDELLAEDGPIARFAGDEVRVILRMTQTYHSLLRESFHPDVLRDALDRDRLLDRLWMQLEAGPHLERVIPAEREDLLQGDIPMFTTRPGSRDLWTSAGERIPEFFSQSGLALARDMMNRLSEPDLARQLWIIRASLATVATGVASFQRRAGVPGDGERAVDRERLLEAARAVGDRLDTLAIRGREGATWLGLNLVDERHWCVAPLGVDLYDGLPGVALFLAYLGSVTGCERYTALARAALTTLRAYVAQMRGQLPMVGGYCGWGGIVYTQAHVGALWNESALVDEAEDLVELLPDLVARDEDLDVIGGSAGCLGSLLALHRLRPGDKTLSAAVLCGERLIARAEPMPDGAGRAVRAAGAERPLSGFSHGAAGMAWALLELAAETNDARFRTAALEMIRYERTLFSASAANWLDLREWVVRGQRPGDPQPCQTFWCHGAPGVGLARLRSLRHLDDPTIREEIAAAVLTTMASGFGYNHSLCHGDLGNLELLLHARRLSMGRPSAGEVDRITSGVVASVERHGWLCGNPLSVESPGLMTGLAGIGYGLLRAADPECVPSVLTLSPPPSAGASGNLERSP